MAQQDHKGFMVLDDWSKSNYQLLAVFQDARRRKEEVAVSYKERFWLDPLQSLALDRTGSICDSDHQDGPREMLHKDQDQR